MSGFHEWILVEIFSDAPLYQLVSSSSDKTPLQRFGSKRQNREAAGRLLTVLDKVRRIGVGRSIEIGLVKRLQGAIVEVKVPGSVIRALAFQENGCDALVIISIERTHQGSGNMHRAIEVARKKESLIKGLLAEKEGK